MRVVCSQPPSPYQVPLLHPGCLGSRGSHSLGMIVVVGHTGEAEVNRTPQGKKEDDAWCTLCQDKLNEEDTRRMSFCPATTSGLTPPFA